MHLTKTTALAAACCTLAGCGLFGKEKLKIDGERIPALNEKRDCRRLYGRRYRNCIAGTLRKTAVGRKTAAMPNIIWGHLAGTQQPEKIWSR